MLWWIIIHTIIISVSMVCWIRFIYIRSFRSSQNANAFLNAALSGLYFMPVFLSAWVVVNTVVSRCYFTATSLYGFFSNLILDSKKLPWERLHNLHVIAAGLLLTAVGAALARNSMTPWRHKHQVLSLVGYAFITIVSVVFFASCWPMFFNLGYATTDFSSLNLQLIVYGLLLISSVVAYTARKNYLFVRYLKLMLKGLFFYLLINLIPSVFLIFKWEPLRAALEFLLDNGVTEGIFTAGIYLVCYGSFLFFHGYFFQQVYQLQPVLLRAIIMMLQASILIGTTIMIIYFKPKLFELIPFLILNLFGLYLLSIIMALVRPEPNRAP